MNEGEVLMHQASDRTQHTAWKKRKEGKGGGRKREAVGVHLTPGLKVMLPQLPLIVPSSYI